MDAGQRNGATAATGLLPQFGRTPAIHRTKALGLGLSGPTRGIGGRLFRWPAHPKTSSILP